MKIVTVNLPETHLDAIARLCGVEYDSQYPSRSEFVRVAIKNQLINDLKLLQTFSHPETIQERKIKDLKKILIKIPIEESRKERDLKMKKTSLEQLRKTYPTMNDYKFIGEA